VGVVEVEAAGATAAGAGAGGVDCCARAAKPNTSKLANAATAEDTLRMLSPFTL